MRWNWQQPDWPLFSYDSDRLVSFEREFLFSSGQFFGAFSNLSEDERDFIKVELISSEAIKTSEIEGEYLERESLQSSIRKQFGLQADHRKVPPAEAGIAEMMTNLYQGFESAIKHETLFLWHSQLMSGRRDLAVVGAYRNDSDPMQVVSGPIHEPKVHFEAPPSTKVPVEMNLFIEWFNRTSPVGLDPLAPLTRAGIAHLYFESIHPFEDGNGRIGRAISEKALAQSTGQPTLIALATVMEANRKKYYSALESASKGNEITDWLLYFADTALKALHHTISIIEFLIEKTKLFSRLTGKLNERQEKCLLRMFREGPDGFSGGLSARNYMSITGATRPTTTRDLVYLVKVGALQRTGERKSTRYYLNIRCEGCRELPR